LSEHSNQESSATVQKRVVAAHQTQTERQGATRNGELSNKDIKQFMNLSPTAKTLLDEAAEKLELSARVYMKMVKLARTIADLESSKDVEKKHVAEALQYRPIRQDI